MSFKFIFTFTTGLAISVWALHKMQETELQKAFALDMAFLKSLKEPEQTTNKEENIEKK